MHTDNLPIEHLVLDLKDPDPAVRSQAALVLGLSGNPSIVDSLLETMAYDTDIQVKRSAAIGLGNIGHPRALEPLFLALNNADAQLRTFAAESLKKLNNPAVIELLSLALQGAGQMKYGAVEAIGIIGDPKALPHLKAIAGTGPKDFQDLVRVTIAKLGGGDIEDFQALIQTALGDPDPQVRANAIEGLGTRYDQDTEVGAALTAALADIDPHVRGKAATTLGAWRFEPALEGLIGLLKDTDGYVRKCAAEALARLGDPRAVPALQEAMANPEDTAHADYLDAVYLLTEDFSA